MSHLSVHIIDLLIILHVADQRWNTIFPPSLFSLQPVTLHSYPSPSLSPCSSARSLGVFYILPPTFSSSQLPPSIFPSFPSPKLSILPPLTPFSPHLFCSLSPLFWFISHPFVLRDPYLLPTSATPLLFLFSPSSLHLLMTLIFSSLLLRSLILCSITYVYLSIYLHIWQSIYPSMGINLPSIIQFDILPSCPQIQSLFSLPFNTSSSSPLLSI